MNYSEKLKSPKWQKKRLEVLNRDKFRCCTCGDEETELHVHHLKYTKEPYDAPLEDLQTLCKVCHNYFTFHNKDILKTFELNENEFERIFKVEQCIIVSYISSLFLFYVNGNELLYITCFDKKSKVLEKLFNSSNNG